MRGSLMAAALFALLGVEGVPTKSSSRMEMSVTVQRDGGPAETRTEVWESDGNSFAPRHHQRVNFSSKNNKSRSATQRASSSSSSDSDDDDEIAAAQNKSKSQSTSKSLGMLDSMRKRFGFKTSEEKRKAAEEKLKADLEVVHQLQKDFMGDMVSHSSSLGGNNNMVFHSGLRGNNNMVFHSRLGGNNNMVFQSRLGGNNNMVFQSRLGGVNNNMVFDDDMW